MIFFTTEVLEREREPVCLLELKNIYLQMYFLMSTFSELVFYSGLAEYMNCIVMVSHIDMAWKVIVLEWETGERNWSNKKYLYAFFHELNPVLSIVTQTFLKVDYSVLYPLKFSGVWLQLHTFKNISENFWKKKCYFFAHNTVSHIHELCLYVYHHWYPCSLF